jgi:hypothetical protein
MHSLAKTKNFTKRSYKSAAPGEKFFSFVQALRSISECPFLLPWTPDAP